MQFCREISSITEAFRFDRICKYELCSLLTCSLTYEVHFPCSTVVLLHAVLVSVCCFDF